MTFGQKCRDWRVVKESFQEGVLKIHTKAESKNKQKKQKTRKACLDNLQEINLDETKCLHRGRNRKSNENVENLE